MQKRQCFWRDNMHKWTQEEIEYIKSICWKSYHADTAKKFNEHFNSDITASQIKSLIGRLKIKTGITGRFTKGRIPHNKGKKMHPDTLEKLRPTLFQKGHKPQTYRPVGSERINRDGYVEIKVGDPSEWELKHRYIYEQKYGKIPKEDIVIFLDNDKTNFDIDNLKHITRRENLYINGHKMRFNDRDTTDAATNIAKLAIKTREKEKSNVNNRAK